MQKQASQTFSNLTKTLLELPLEHVALRNSLNNLNLTSIEQLCQMAEVVESQNFKEHVKMPHVTEYIVDYICFQIQENKTEDKEFGFNRYWSIIENLSKSKSLCSATKQFLIEPARIILNTLKQEDLDGLETIFKRLAEELHYHYEQMVYIISETISDKFSSSHQTELFLIRCLEYLREKIGKSCDKIADSIDKMRKQISITSFQVVKMLNKQQQQLLLSSLKCLRLYNSILIEKCNNHSKKNKINIGQQEQSSWFYSTFNTVYNFRRSSSAESEIVSITKKQLDHLFNDLKTQAFRLHTLLVWLDQIQTKQQLNPEKSYVKELKTKFRGIVTGLKNEYQNTNIENKSDKSRKKLMESMAGFLNICLNYQYEKIELTQILSKDLEEMFYYGFQANSIIFSQGQQNNKDNSSKTQQFSNNPCFLTQLFKSYLMKNPSANILFIQNVVGKIKANLHCSAKSEQHQNIFSTQSLLCILKSLIHYNCPNKQKLPKQISYLVNDPIMLKLQERNQLSAWLEIINSTDQLIETNEGAYEKLCKHYQEESNQNSNNKCNDPLFLQCKSYLQKLRQKHFQDFKQSFLSQFEVNSPPSLQ